jgi:hypothetical protein
MCEFPETKDLAETDPALTTKLFERYKQLARSMYAPNMPPSHNQLDANLGLSAVAAALDAPDACDNDECWERKAHQLQLQREAAAVGGVQCWDKSGTPLQQLIAAPWLLGAGITFSFDVVQGGTDSHISMQIVKGCSNCAFTAGVGSVTSNTISLVAYGKGHNVTHNGEMTTNKDGTCRIHWVSKTNTWQDFCQGKPCAGDIPKTSGGDACKKMLANGGIWQPYVETPGWPLA